ncbi:MAG: putative DNA binding domain-containing protein [Bacteroidales bacterium]|jgi:ATP-dependent DNA helicase RecG|nr:putative DNA binding domain-containing protein [Bacteroidales bacterium]
MENMLIIQERVKNTIALGESHFREFKTALEGKPDSKKPRLAKKICEDIGEALVSFANADGGELLIGVEDDGIITGIPHSEEDIDTMLAATKTHIYHGQELPLSIATKLDIDGKTILYFAVNKGVSQIYQLPDGRCVRRKDKSTMPESVDKIHFERQEIRSREYDSQFVDGALVTDLDLSFLQGVADSYIKGLSIELFLQQTGLAAYGTNGLRLKRAALLLFAKSNEIGRWHSKCQIRFLKVNGNELKSGENYNVISDESVQGNIFDLWFKSWENLRPYLAYKTEFGSDAKFEQKYIYPEDACKETVLNAIAHRDYSNQNGIEIYIFNDRIEIKSPGALLSTITIKNLYELEGAHESRNPLIARILREYKLMRELGEGMRRIFNLMDENELERPTLYSNGSWFKVTLSNKTVYSPKQQEWLNLFIKNNLTNNQKKIVLLGMDGKEISPADIKTALRSDDLLIYNTEVTELRKKEILISIRDNMGANNLAKKLKKKKDQIPRFKVICPK